MIKLANALSRRQREIVVVTFSDAGENTLSSELHQSISVVTAGGRRSASPFLWLRVHKILGELSPDIVVGWSTYANLVAALLSASRRKWRLVLSERNYLPLALAVGSGESPTRKKLVLYAIKKLYRRADVLTANSQQSLKFLRRFCKSGPAFRLLPNMIDVQSIELLRSAESGLQSPNNVLKVLVVARLVYQKGVDLLIEALARLHRDTLVAVAIVGEGDEEERLQALSVRLQVDDLITWVGKRSNPYPFYAWADMVVVPSRHEGFPNVPLEAMATGAAVICADCKTGPREMTGNGAYGELIPVDDVDALANAIDRLGGDNQKLQRMAGAAREYVVRHYEESIVVDTVLDVFSLAGTSK